MQWKKNKPKVSLTWSLTKCQPDPKPHPGGYVWPEANLTEVVTQLAIRYLCWGSICPKVSLTKRYDKIVNLIWSLTYRGLFWPEVNLTEVVTHLVARCLCLGAHLTKGHPDPQIWQNVNLIWSLIYRVVHLTRGQPDWSSNTLGHKMSLPGVHLTKGQPDLKIWQKCQPDPKPHLWGSIWLSTERLCEHLNTLCILGLASQRSFLQRTNNSGNYLLISFV